jgi:hypothetical protein
MGRKEKGLAKSQETDFTSDIYNGGIYTYC